MKKILAGNPEYFRLKEAKEAIEKGRLLCLIMNLPFSCNYNCLKCYRKKNKKFDDFGLKLRKEKIKEAKDLGVRTIYIAGEGEPLLHWSIVRELIEHNNSLGLITTLYTNGSLLTKEIAIFLFEHNVSLIVSCDSFTPLTYKKLTGGGDFSIIKNNLEMTSRVYQDSVEKNNGTTVMRLALITIVNKQNKGEIASIKQWCDKRDVFFICNYPIKAGCAIENWEWLVGDEMDELIKISNCFTDTGYGGLSAPLEGGGCIALYAGITIDTDGKALVCPASVESCIGDIKNESIKDLWKKTREYVKEQGNPKCIAREKRPDNGIPAHL